MSCLVAESPRLAVFVKGWPRLSETFIAQELLALQERGVPFVIVSLRRPADSKRHPLHEAVTVPVLYLPEYLHLEPLRLLRALLRGRWGRVPRSLKPDAWRRWGQSVVASAELPRTVQGIYAHFLHSPSTVAEQVAAMRGVPWAASAHAKDIYTSPPDDLRAKLSSAVWVTTCTAANVAYLRNLAAKPERVTLSYHGLDTTRFPLAVSAPGA
ncbi:MAG: colanic acid biosynthesis glycosyltransferase WcaL, partial [Thalassospira sp.]|nr:colanic acid biosynthesis glycosyltransferase WcaL [Thalassospira sp.]